MPAQIDCEFLHSEIVIGCIMIFEKVKNLHLLTHSLVPRAQPPDSERTNVCFGSVRISKGELVFDLPKRVFERHIDCQI